MTHHHIITSTHQPHHPMKKSNFTPKNDLEAYLTESYFNVFGYIELNEDPMCIGLISPLLFFNLLWQYHFTILTNKANPLKILKRLHTVKLNSPQRCYLFHRLLLSFNKVCVFSKNENYRDPKLISCLELIKSERDKLYKQLYPDKTIHDCSFDFDYVRKNCAFITLFEDQKTYLNSVILEYRQCDHPHLEDHSSSPYYVPFDKKCSLLLEFIEKFKSSETELPGNILAVSSYDKISAGNPGKIIDKESVIAYTLAMLNSMHPKKWNYFFFNQTDLNTFLNAIAEYFISGKCIMPPIVLQKLCKTRLCIALNSIYHHYKGVPVNEFSGILKLLKKLPAFEEQTNHQIYKSLTRSKG